jgi:hypothetical protein
MNILTLTTVEDKVFPITTVPKYDKFLERAIRELGAEVTLVRETEDSLQAHSIEPSTFEDWLETPLGQEVLQRIWRNKHRVNMNTFSAYFDTIEDVQQKALIWLWQEWQKDSTFYRYIQCGTTLSHCAALLTRTAIQRGRCMYAKRRYEQREIQTDLMDENGEQKCSLFPVLNIRATDVEDHDKVVCYIDKHTDVWNAIERVVQRMLKHYTEGHLRRDGTPNKRFVGVPIEQITRTIIEGHMYHYTGRYAQTGTFRKFCEARGVSKSQIARWRPIIFTFLCEELSGYAPVTTYAH